MNIKNNENDQSLFTSMNNVFVNDYFKNVSNKNPISINTTNKKKNKCLLLKLIPKNILSHIISFADCEDRGYWRRVSYTFYQASNDSISKHSLVLQYHQTQKIFRQETVYRSQFYGFSHIDWRWYPWRKICDLNTVTSGLLRHATSVKATSSTLTAKPFFDALTSDPVRHNIKCIATSGAVAFTNVGRQTMQQLLNRCYKINKLCITPSLSLGYGVY